MSIPFKILQMISSTGETGNADEEEGGVSDWDRQVIIAVDKAKYVICSLISFCVFSLNALLLL